MQRDGPHSVDRFGTFLRTICSRATPPLTRTKPYLSQLALRQLTRVRCQSASASGGGGWNVGMFVRDQLGCAPRRAARSQATGTVWRQFTVIENLGGFFSKVQYICICTDGYLSVGRSGVLSDSQGVLLLRAHLPYQIQYIQYNHYTVRTHPPPGWFFQRPRLVAIETSVCTRLFLNHNSGFSSSIGRRS